MTSYPFDSLTLTKYLGLPKDYTPRAESEPLQFLALHLHSLPPHLLIQFSNILTPHQRASISLIKNRRTQYALSRPPELSWDEGHRLEPLLWEAPSGSGIRPGAHNAQQEREWTDAHFVGYNSPLPGHRKGGHVKKLGDLLAEYEEDREADRIRALRRERASQAAAERETQEEFDSDSDSDDDDSNVQPEEPESLEDAQREFERMLRERFISGLLDSHLYDQVDYDDKWDPDSRDQEDSWFDDEEES